MNIDRTQYQTEHYGRLPRGDADWAFLLGRDGAWTEFIASAPFAIALAAAKRQARALGCTDIVVQA